MKTVMLSLEDEEYKALSRLVAERNNYKGRPGVGEANTFASEVTITEVIREAIDAMYGSNHDEVKKQTVMWKSAPGGRRPYTE